VSTYLGLDVLDQLNHNMRESIQQSFDRFGSLTVNPGGRKQWDDFAGQPLTARTFEWFASGRAAAASLRAFLIARQGRLVPFWTPTWCADLNMTADAAAAAAAITVTKAGYGQFLFAFKARRYLAITSPGGGFLMRKTTLVVDNGNGTETITLDAGLGVDLLASGTLVSFLTLCRLDEDQSKVRWYGRNLAEATLRFREIPLETPAP